MAADRPFEVADIEPRCVFAPHSELEAAEMLASARSAGNAVIVVGGGTLLSIGNPPARYDVALSTAGLQGVVEYNPADLTIVARAGTTMAELASAMEPHGQFLPLEPPLPERATLGGSLAANVSGPWRSAFGSGRDMVIGMRMALPSGQVAKSGGRVVKNVAGYDLAKLFTGSFGTLGAIVEVALKTYPRPARVETLVMPTTSLRDAIERGRRLRDLGPGVLCVAVLNVRPASSGDPEGGAPLVTDVGVKGPVVVVEVGGTERAAHELAGAVRREGGRATDEEEAVRLHALIRDFPARASAKLSVPASHTGETVPGRDVDYLGYPLLGLAYLSDLDLSPQEVLDLRRRLAPFGGSVVLQEAPLDLVRAVDAWGEAGPALALMRKVKNTFDPDRVMSPGRYLPGIEAAPAT